MVRINFDLDDAEHRALTQKVGSGKVGPTLRKYIKRIISATDSEDLFALQKRLELVEEQKRKTDDEYFDIKSKIDALEENTRLTELDKLKEEEKFKQKKLKEALRVDDAIGASGMLEEIDVT